MRNLLFILLAFVSLASASARANELEPFINFLRGTPAYMDGEVTFRKDSVLYEEGWTIVKLLAGRKMEFTFKEDYLQVRPLNGFYVKYGGMRVLIKSVTWTPSGMKTISEFPADFTGLSRNKVSREVAAVLEEIFGKQLPRANALLKRVRRQNSLGGIFEIAKSIVFVFTRSDSTSGVSLPAYYGELGLNFLPPAARAFNLYGMRVGIKANDHYRAGFSFNGDMNGIYPYAAELVSSKGSDINQGKEYLAMKRLVLETVTLDASGIGLKLHLGASEVIGGVLSAIEDLARRRGETASCPRCQETASFPAIRIQIEGWVRTAIMAQIDAYWSLLPGFNVSRSVMSQFKKREACRTTNLSCLAACSRNNNNPDDIQACKERCDRSLNICLRK